MGNDDQLSRDMLFTPTQVQVLRWAPVLPALLSVMGSLIIIQRIVRSRKLLAKSYERLMLGLSVVDTLNSIRLIIFPLAFRPFYEPSTACTIDGFLITLCFAGPMYNAALTVYYVLIIVYNVPNQRISRQYEPWLHIMAVGYGVMGAFIGLPLKVYNPEKDGLACWAVEWPHGCVGEECERGASSEAFTYAVGLLPLIGILFLLVAANAIIYCTVRRIVAKTERYTNPTAASMASSTITLSNHSGHEREPSGISSNEAFTTTIPIPKKSNNTMTRSSPSKTKAVAVQSVLYVMAYLVSFIWSLLINIVGTLDPDGVAQGHYFYLNVLQMIFYPIQGFFNAFVYILPTVARIRRHEPHRSLWECIWAVLFE